VTLTPAYGRDYRTAKAAKTDWLAGKDFIIADLFGKWDGKPTSIADRESLGKFVTIRFCGLTKICSV